MPLTPIDDVRSADGTRLARFRAEPAGSVRGEVLLVHGFADHMGRYDHVADALTAAGYRVTGLDLRGHGRSDGKRGFVARWDDYLADVDAAVAKIDGSPYLVAHSMGALVTLDWLRTRQAKGVVLSAPLLKAKVAVPKWKVIAAKTLTRLVPSLSMGNELHASEVSRHPDVIKAYDTDPLVFKTATPRWYTEMIAAAARVIEAAPKYTTPMLLMWGTGERIVDPDAIAAFGAIYGGPKDLRIWDGFYHELFNEPERADVLDVTTKWLEMH
jgi:alpha-beta hydrolase superfamily lysophospholipase